MKKKLMSTYLAIIMITLIVTVLFSWNRVKVYLVERVDEESTAQIQLLKDLLSDQRTMKKAISNDFTEKYALKIQSRITIIDSEGEVIADSEKPPELMDNHKNREEVRGALEKQQVVTSFRFSSTLHGYYNYVAIPIEMSDFTGVIRTAKPIEEINKIIFDMIMAIVFGIVIGAIISIVVAYFLTKKFMEPIQILKETALKISKGSYDENISIHQEDEIGELADAFNAMTISLRVNVYTLEEKNAELESILESMGNGIMAISPEYKIMMFNDRFLKLFDIQDQEIEGKLFYEITRNLVIFELLENALETWSFTVKEANIHVEGKEKSYLIYANPIRSQWSKVQILGVLLVVQDVTEIRKLENMRSDFVSNVTHELKTPLTSIRGFVDTLKGGALEDHEVANKFLDIIDIEAERLEGLIHDILILSEIEAMFGEKNLCYHPPFQIVQEVVELLKSEAEKKKIQICMENDENVVDFKCNKDRIKQLLINLISNAIQYTDQGQVTIRCREDFKFLVFEVEDTGIGIEKKHISRLFERFYRVDRGRSRTTGGTGLGLSIVKHIVELYNGKIKVDSKVGEGTKITVRLPYSQ